MLKKGGDPRAHYIYQPMYLEFYKFHDRTVLVVNPFDLKPFEGFSQNLLSIFLKL